MESRRCGEDFRLPPGIPHTRTAPPKSLSKKSVRTLASPISLKSEVNPQIWWRLLPLYPSFSGATSGQFEPEQPWDGGSSGGFSLSADRARPGWRVRSNPEQLDRRTNRSTSS